MNTWQVLQQIKFLLLQRKWEGNALARDVFQDNSVVISTLGDEPAMATLIPPTAMIQPLAAQSDPQHDEEPNLLLQGMNLRITTTVPGDYLGEYALIGGGRQSQTDSRGRGLLEVEEEVFSAIELLETNAGVVIFSRAKGAAESEIDDNDRYTAARSYNFEILTTASRFYHPVQNFIAVDGAPTFADLTWDLPPARFDTRGVRILRVAGATPTTDPLDAGAIVVLDGSTNPDPGAESDRPFPPGEYSYSAFATYSEYGTATNERFSEGRSSTVTVT